LFLFFYCFRAGIILNDFYAFPSPAVLIGIIAAFYCINHLQNEKLIILIAGCGDSKIITVFDLFISCSFVVVSKAMGGVDAVNLGINVAYFTLGIFFDRSFLSTATGTSVGAIVAIGPIAVCLQIKAEPLTLNFGALLGGSMLGDNLSMISDTTIAATQSLG
jgi:Na+/H+ antiporter NhaC